LRGDLDKFMDVLGAASATAVTLEVKLGFKLVGHHDSSPTRRSDLRFGDSFAQAHVHGILPFAIMRSILSMPDSGYSVNSSKTLY
jgi:hypothetical protein